MKTKQISQEWKEVELGEICEIKKGKSITKATLTEGDIPVIAGGQKPAYYHNTANRTGETITVSGSGAYAGFVAYFNIPIFASDCSTIQTDNKEVFMKYIYYFLKSQQKNIYDLQKGIAQPHIYPKQIQVIKIPLPPLQTQKAIVSILEKSETLKQKRKESDMLTKEYLQSLFYEMILKKNNFETKKLNDICVKITDGVHSKPVYTNSGIPFISVINVAKQFLNFDNCKYISKKDHEVYYKRCNPERNDILYTKVGATYGIASIVDTDQKFSLYVSVCLIKPDHTKVNAIYLKSLMNMSYIKNQADKRIKGIGVPDLHLIEIKNFNIPLPPIKLQQKFASIVEHVEKLKEKQKQSLGEIEQLHNSLMKKAFRGDLI